MPNEKEGWKPTSYKDHSFSYIGSGVIYKCDKCGIVEDLFNGGLAIQYCKTKRSQHDQS